MTKINPYVIVKQAGISPGAATLAAIGLGGGLGFLWDKFDEAKGNPPENPWRRAILGASLLGAPLWAYGLARSSWDTDEAGNHTVPFLKRWFSDDSDYWSNETPQKNWEKSLEERRKFYPDSENFPRREKKGEWVSTIGDIPVNAFNETTWIDASRGRTPMEAAGFVTNTLNQTSKRVGSGIVTPGQVINNMVNAGIGYGTAWLAGKTLGAMANVSPATQNKLCEIGTWGGMLGGISNAANYY